jgi:Na+/H+ antiporter NhaD/arsenite permease-like protein
VLAEERFGRAERSVTGGGQPEGLPAAIVGRAAPLVQTFQLALANVVPLGLFLTAAIWVAELAEQAGLAGRLADALARSARKPLLYALVCALFAALTATVSLDGAVVLMVPLLLALARQAEELFRLLLLGTVAVASAFSLAVPQGNPTNLVVMQRLGLSPGAFVAHLFAPALLATLVCMTALALAERAALRGCYPQEHASRGALSPGERLAATALAAAAVAGAAAPWLGIAPWWARSAASRGSFTRAPVPFD